MADSVLPHNLEAEKAILGALLIQPDASAALATLDPNDFFRDAHRCIVTAMAQIVERGDTVDPLTLKDALAQTGHLESIGGPVYIGALMDGVPRSSNIEQYAKIVKRLATRRALIYAANNISTAAYKGDGDLGSIVARASRSLERIAAQQSIGSRALKVLSEHELSSIGQQPWIVEDVLPIGISVLAAPSGVGKTTFAFGASVSSALGRPFLDRHVSSSRPVVLVLGEGASQAEARLRAAKIAAGFDPDADIGISVVPHSVNLFETGQAYEELRRLVTDTQPVVMFDTLGLNSVGADENSASDMTQVFANARRLGAPALVFMHHMGVSAERERGSSAIRANSDALLTLLDVDDTLVLNCEKMRDGAAFDRLRLRLFPVPGTNACSVGLADQRPSASSISPAQCQALEVLRSSFPGGARRSEWRALLPTMKERTFYHAVGRLRELSYVTEQHGRFAPSRRTL